MTTSCDCNNCLNRLCRCDCHEPYLNRIVEGQPQGYSAKPYLFAFACLFICVAPFVAMFLWGPGR